MLWHKTSWRVLRMDSGETRTITCYSGVQQGDPMGPAMFYLALRPGLDRCRDEFEGEEVEAVVYMDEGRSLSLSAL